MSREIKLKSQLLKSLEEELGISNCSKNMEKTSTNECNDNYDVIKDGPFLKKLAEQMQEKNHYDLALRFYKLAQESGEKDIDVRIAVCYHELGKIEEALVCYEKAANTGNLDAMITLYVHYYETNDIKKMVKYSDMIAASRQKTSNKKSSKKFKRKFNRKFNAKINKKIKR